MNEFTAEMLNTLSAANESVKGTNQYSKYYMETDCKSDNGKWFFVGHNIPYTTGTIKTFKGNTYIITQKERYHVTDAVKELLGIQQTQTCPTGPTGRSENAMQTIKEIRQSTGLSQTKFGEVLNIPMRTLQDWEREVRKCPDYVVELIAYRVANDPTIPKTEDGEEK